MNARNPAWIISARFDCAFILGPALLVSALAVLWSRYAAQAADLPSWLWLLLVVGIDAGHVYATLFRTYLVTSQRQNHNALFTLAPLLAWLVGSLLYSVDALLFWRMLAYLAVFHFIRQQYGFMMIYARHERYPSRFYRVLDKAAIYSATLFPLIYWHCQGRRFDWLIDGDFILVEANWLWRGAALVYSIILVLYLLKEAYLWQRQQAFNLPRNLLLLGTASSWFVGIVACNNDLIFTATNVIAHGVPYYALIWGYGKIHSQSGNPQTEYAFPALRFLFQWRFAPLYLLLLFTLAYFEEGLWEALVWRDHPYLFVLFAALPQVDNNQTLTWLVPLLAVPQATHYILDAFIWRLKRAGQSGVTALFQQNDTGPTQNKGQSFL